jgi:hypothetical protein
MSIAHSSSVSNSTNTGPSGSGSDRTRNVRQTVLMQQNGNSSFGKKRCTALSPHSSPSLDHKRTAGKDSGTDEDESNVTTTVLAVPSVNNTGTCNIGRHLNKIISQQQKPTATNASSATLNGNSRLVSSTAIELLDSNDDRPSKVEHV